MLSKKMAFSLIRLITILTFAFVVPLVMAQENNIRSSLDMTDDISHKDGFQMEYLGSLDVTIQFDKLVDLTPADLLIRIFDGNGAFLASPISTSVRISRSQTDVKNWSVGTASPLPATARHIRIRVAAGVESSDPSEDSRTEGGDYAIELLGPDLGIRPDVYEIALVGFPFATITTATFQVYVLLSEEPKDGFTADFLEVTDAIVTSVVKLVSPGPSTTVNGTTVRASWRDDSLHAYLVTLTSKPGEKTVVIKVKNFAGMERPTTVHHTYTRPPDSALTEGKDILMLKTNWDGTRTVVITVYPPDDTATPADTDAITTPENRKVDATVVQTVEKMEKAETIDKSVSIPTTGQIYISEIMFAGGGTLPQWIEIANSSRTEQVNLSRWTLMVENAMADTDVSVGPKVMFTIPEGTRIDPSGQNDTPSTILIVTEQGRNNLEGTMAVRQIFNLWTYQQLGLIQLGITERRYSLLSDMAFKITLTPPGPDVAPAIMDVVGNLASDGTVAWTLPMETEGDARSSIIRRHVQGSAGSAEPKEGTMIESWVLASNTGFAQGTHGRTQSYYGLPTDISTPGFRAGGALPVELSYFCSERDESGTVVITWSTQSELNNAGFFIKRSQQRDGEFRIINATMVAGAGTTSEKQFYTYEDTTVQPNVVYYYQIEDVSLDGNRQTLTRGVRLKGHVGTAGKVTTLWGTLKASGE